MGGRGKRTMGAGWAALTTRQPSGATVSVARSPLGGDDAPFCNREPEWDGSRIRAERLFAVKKGVFVKLQKTSLTVFTSGFWGFRALGDRCPMKSPAARPRRFPARDRALRQHQAAGAHFVPENGRGGQDRVACTSATKRLKRTKGVRMSNVTPRAFRLVAVRFLSVQSFRDSARSLPLKTNERSEERSAADGASAVRQAAPSAVGGQKGRPSSLKRGANAT